MIYLDNASTTECCELAKKAIIDSINIYGNSNLQYKIATQSKRLIIKSKENIAKCFHTTSEKVYFTSGGSESDTWAIIGSCKHNTNRNVIITSEFEHSAVLESCKYLSLKGYEIIYLKPNENGIITVEELSKHINKNVLLVSIMYVNNEIGTVQPIKELAKLSHKFGSLFHCDAVQACGHIDISFDDLNVDYLSASAHKFYGPKGIGILLCKDIESLDNIIYGGHQQNGKRPGTENTMLIYSCATALDFCMSNIKEHYSHCNQIKAYLIESLKKQHINFLVNCFNDYPYIISLQIPGIENEALVNYMDLHNIAISYGSACNTGNLDPSHVLESVHLSDDEANSTIRVSFSYKNTKKDIDEFVMLLKLFINK